MKMDMKDEGGPEKLLPEGVYDFKINSCEAKDSKAGKPMIVAEVIEKDSGASFTVYMTAVQGKRWFLKQLLTVAGIVAGADGVYEWEPIDLINKEVSGRIEHYKDNDWIDRNGVTKPGSTKAKIAEWHKLGEDESLPF